MIHFNASRAIDGAGIYEVTLDRNLNYTGTSTDGKIFASCLRLSSAFL